MRAHRPRPAFTLVELLVVLAVVGVLAAILFAVSRKVLDASRRKAAATEIQLLQTKLNDFRLEYGFLPACTNIAVAGGDYGHDPAAYAAASRTLFFALTGRPTFDHLPGRDTSLDGKRLLTAEGMRIADPDAPPAQTLSPRYRESFPGPGPASGSHFLDPWGDPYGFHHHPQAPGGSSAHTPTSYDLWSTGGHPGNRGKWITSW